MKKLFTILTGLLLTASVFSQVPLLMTYQAVIRDNSGSLIANTPVGVQISILQGSSTGTVVFTETHTPVTNANGLISLQIGNGANQTGTISAIGPSTGPYFIKTETDPTGGTTYTISGTNQLLSVPYALYAGSAGGQWSLIGNSGTVDGIDFIGTTDNVPLNMRVNNQPSGRIDPTLYNSFFGYQSGITNTLGNHNTGTGHRALNFNSTGNFNTANGNDALSLNTTGNDNVAVGYQALNTNSTGSFNSAVGNYALSMNITGNRNTASGMYALYSNTTGDENTALGVGSLWSNTTGSQNTASGENALDHNTVGHGNTASGNNTLGFNTVGNYLTATGLYALNQNTTGNYNTASGGYALYTNTTGEHNTACGSNALYSNLTGNNNTVVGADADVAASGLHNATAIGSGAIVDASDKVRIGNSAVSIIEGNPAFYTTSDARFKTNIADYAIGLGLILKLRPVTYNFQYSKFSAFLGERSVDQKVLADKETKTEMGFLAQDIEKACTELGLKISNLVHIPENEKDNYSVAYSEFVVPLVKGMQEQQKMIDELKNANQLLQKRIEQLEKK